MARQENTKIKFLEEALRLFSERGYDAVKISEIADAVGCTAPALYKHYENKQMLYDALLEYSKDEFDKSMDIHYGNHYSIIDDRVNDKTDIHLDDVISLTQDIIRVPLHNEIIKNFRKLMQIEQYHKPELAKLYDDRYIYKHVDKHAEVFGHLIDKGIMIPGDPYTRANAYVLPLVVFLEMCDRDPTKEEWVLDRVKDHILDFVNTYFRCKMS